MGKRKKSSRKPQGPKKKENLRTTFSCLFCNGENSVTVNLDKKAGTGGLACKTCGQQYQTGINYLSAAVDVYSDWIDACDDVAKSGGDALENEGGMNPYYDLAAGTGGESSTMHLDRHLVSTVEGDDDG